MIDFNELRAQARAAILTPQTTHSPTPRKASCAVTVAEVQEEAQLPGHFVCLKGHMLVRFVCPVCDVAIAKAA